MKKEKEKTVERKFLSEEQAAEYLCCAKNTLKDWRMRGSVTKQGLLPPRHYVRGKHIYYEIHELEAWVLEGASR